MSKAKIYFNVSWVTTTYQIYKLYLIALPLTNRKHEQSLRVMVTIFNVNADNAAWVPVLWWPIEMILQHCASDIALTNETCPHVLPHFSLVF